MDGTRLNGDDGEVEGNPEGAAVAASITGSIVDTGFT